MRPAPQGRRNYQKQGGRATVSCKFLPRWHSRAEALLEWRAKSIIVQQELEERAGEYGQDSKRLRRPG